MTLKNVLCRFSHLDAGPDPTIGDVRRHLGHPQARYDFIWSKHGRKNACIFLMFWVFEHPDFWDCFYPFWIV